MFKWAISQHIPHQNPCEVLVTTNSRSCECIKRRAGGAGTRHPFCQLGTQFTTVPSVPTQSGCAEQHAPCSASLTQLTKSLCCASSRRQPRRGTVIPSSSLLARTSSGLMESSFCILYDSSFSVYKARGANKHSVWKWEIQPVVQQGKSSAKPHPKQKVPLLSFKKDYTKAL